MLTTIFIEYIVIDHTLLCWYGIYINTRIQILDRLPLNLTILYVLLLYFNFVPAKIIRTYYLRFIFLPFIS